MEDIKPALSSIFDRILSDGDRERRESGLYLCLLTDLERNDLGEACFDIRRAQSDLARSSVLAFSEAGHSLGKSEMEGVFQLLPPIFRFVRKEEERIKRSGCAWRTRERILQFCLSKSDRIASESGVPDYKGRERIIEYPLYSSILMWLRENNPGRAIESVSDEMSNIAWTADLAFRDSKTAVLDQGIFDMFPMIIDFEVGIPPLTEWNAMAKAALEKAGI